MRMVMEESKQSADPHNPDVDNMSYEQLLEMSDNAGKVSRGLAKGQIDAIKAFMWIEGRTEYDSCTICMERYVNGTKCKRLPCKHDYHAECVNKWLETAKKCPVCSKEVRRRRR